MFQHLQGQGRHGAGRRVGHFWRKPAVDQPGRQMPAQIDHLFPGQPGDRLRDTRPDARKGGGGGEQRIKDFGAHEQVLTRIVVGLIS